MTASVANGFAQVMFDPKASKCTEKPYAFHPQFSTSVIQTRAEWTAHTLNVAYSDEIGHFEYCDKVLANGNCAGKSATDPTNDRDDIDCFAPSASLLVKVGGCITDFDDDFDGPSYLKVWPGNGNAMKNTSEPSPVHQSDLQQRPSVQPGQFRDRPAVARTRLRILHEHDAQPVPDPAQGVGLLPDVHLGPVGLGRLRVARRWSRHPERHRHLRRHSGEVLGQGDLDLLSRRPALDPDLLRELRQRLTEQPVPAVT